MGPNINCQITKNTIQEQSAHLKLKGAILEPEKISHPSKIDHKNIFPKISDFHSVLNIYNLLYPPAHF